MNLQNHHEAQIESRVNAIEEEIDSNIVKNAAQTDSSQADLHTLEKNKVTKVRNQEYNVMTIVWNRVQDAMLTAMESLVIPRVEMAIKSADASSCWYVDSVVEIFLDFLGNIEGLEMITSSKINSNTGLNKVDETHGNITAEEGDLLVNERNFYRLSHTHHTSQLSENVRKRPKIQKTHRNSKAPMITM